MKSVYALLNKARGTNCVFGEMRRKSGNVVVLFILFLISASYKADAQSTILSETFTATTGATSGSNWYLDMTDCSVGYSNYLKVVSNRMEARGTLCEATWYSYPIDISQYSGVSLSAAISEVGDLEGDDRLQIMYSIDGAAFQHFATNGNKYDDFTSATASQTGLSGKYVVIKFIAYNTINTEYYYIDNILVRGYPKDNIYLLTDATDGSCSVASSIDLTVAPITMASSTTSPYGSTPCTVTLWGSNSYTLYAGQVGCINGSFNGGVTLSGGTLINKGSASFAWFNFNSGTLVNNGSLSVSNLSLSGGRNLYNYGTMTNSGTLTVTGTLHNYGSLTSSGLTINSGGYFLNTNEVAVYGSVTNNATITNSGTFTSTGTITNNSSSVVTNNGALLGGGLAIYDDFDNHGGILISGSSTIGSTGSLVMSPGAYFNTANITVSGSIVNSGTTCANIGVSSSTTVNSSGSMNGKVHICDANGVETNNSVNYSNGAGLNCNCSGGGFTYLWSNGATTQDITGMATGTYTVTVTGPNGSTATGSASVTTTGSMAGNPADFGSNVWNVYAWNAGNSSGGSGSWSSNYSGYYVINSLNFDTRTGQTFSTAQSWADNLSPSSAAGYQGCPVDNDYHSYAFKREGFPCGNYTISLPNHDDRAELYINGVLEYSIYGCCATRSNVWSGFLGASSTVELRIAEGNGGSHGSIQLVKSTDLAITSSAATMGCSDGARTLTANIAGGTWSGNGVSGNSFSPATAGNGTHTVTYTLNGCSATQQITVGGGGNPSIFGSNVWNVYAWDAGSSTGGSGAWTNNFSGYYVINSLSFDTRTGQTYSTAESWNSNASPSSALGYQGCAVGNDSHSYAFKRQGFPCGNYTFNLPNNDDRVELYVDGVLEYSTNSCCSAKPSIWTGFLGASSTVELRISEGGGGSHGSLELVKNADIEVTATTAGSRCGTGTVSLQATPSSGSVINWYAASSGGSVLSGGSGANTFTTPSISSTTTYYAQATHAATGCVSARTAVVATVASGSASISGINTVCNGSSSTFTATGGGTYAWSTGAATAAISVSTAGTYTVTVTNGGCTATASRTLTTSSSITVTTSKTNVTCGFCTNGTAGVSASGGTAPYTYAWSNGATATSLTNLAPGTYSVTVTDANSCTATATAMVNLPLQVNIAGASACSATSGSATASGVGGTAPFTFVWSTGATTATISNLSSGTYHVTATDASGATATQSVAISNTNVVASMSPASATICAGDSVQLTASGADVYSWAPATGLDNANIATPMASPTVTTTYSLNVGVTSGELVTNGNFEAGNTGFTSAYGAVYAPGNSNKLQPEGLYAVDTNARNYHNNFFGTGHGAPGSKFMIINGATQPGQTIWSQTVNITPNTNYNFATWITSVNASSPAQLRFEINGTLLGPVIAAPSTLYTWVPFNTSWNSGSATSAVISIVNENASAGGNDYGLDDISFTTVCNVNHGSVTVTVKSPPQLSASAGAGSVDLSVTGGTAPYTYSWSNAATSQDVSLVEVGGYTVTVTDATGCTATTAATVTTPGGPCVCIATGNWSSASTWSGNCSGGGGKYAGHLDDIVIQGFKVTVDSAHTVKSLVLMESELDTTRLSFTGTNSLDVLEGFSMNTVGTGKDVDLDIDGSANFIIRGDFVINHAKGNNIVINLNQNNGNNAKLVVEGNLDMTMTSTAVGDLLIYARAAYDTIQVYGDILYKNSRNNSGNDMFITMNSSSKLIVGGDINFDGVRSGNMSLTLNGSSLMQLSGSVVRKDSPTKFGRVVMNSTSSLVLNGTEQQTLDGTTGNTDHNLYRAITVNNSSPVSPQVVLNGDVTITSTLTMIDGDIGTGDNMIILTNTSASALSGHSANSYIVGTLRRYIASNTATYDFPLGYGGPNQYYWASITNNLMIGPSYLTATFGQLPVEERNEHIYVEDDGEVYTRINPVGIWTIDPNTQPILGSYTIEVGTENVTNLVDDAFRIIKRPTKSGRQSWGNGNIPRGLIKQVDRLVGNGKTSLAGLTSFSDFGIGEGEGGSLPIDLVGFDANPEGEKVRLDWTVSMEINNDYFTIERSLDGRDWEKVTTVKGAGNHSEEKEYVAYDENPYMGLSYYRLRQTDFDGKTKAYDMVSVTMTNDVTFAITSIEIYPNPNKGSFMLYLDTPFDEVSVMVLNNMGQLVHYNELLSTSGQTRTPIDLGTALATGMYFVKVHSGGSTYIKQMIIE